MSDIVKRLRAPAYWISGSSEGHEGDNSAPLEAADEIERLRAELEQCQQTLYRQIGLTIEASEEATKASATEIERLKAALREIDQQRYTGRNTINPDNAYEMAVAINAKLLAVMDIARTALKEDGNE